MPNLPFQTCYPTAVLAITYKNIIYFTNVSKGTSYLAYVPWTAIVSDLLDLLWRILPSNVYKNWLVKQCEMRWHTACLEYWPYWCWSRNISGETCKCHGFNGLVSCASRCLASMLLTMWDKEVFVLCTLPFVPFQARDIMRMQLYYYIGSVQFNT